MRQGFFAEPMISEASAQAEVRRNQLLEQGKRRADSIKQLLEECDRRKAGFTAPAKGLCLTEVVYDKAIFSSKVQPDFLWQSL